MSTEFDLRELLEQNQLLVKEIRDTAHKLVFEVEASHYWTTYSLDVAEKLIAIGNNLGKLLEFAEARYEDGAKMFNHEPAMKLWNTASGLLRALPPVYGKLSEHLSKRRRQRIMGQTEIEDVEIEAETKQNERKRLEELLASIGTMYAALGTRFAAVPDDLAPSEELLIAQSNGKLDDEHEHAAASAPDDAPSAEEEPL